eukprot:Colp12_sorted_trinity150504_noHs@4356
MEFEADVLVLYHPSQLKKGSQVTVYIGGVRQAATLESTRDEQGQLCTGARASIRVRFLRQPECIQPGARLLFREGRCKGIGTITKIYPLDQPAPLATAKTAVARSMTSLPASASLAS